MNMDEKQELLENYRLYAEVTDVEYTNFEQFNLKF